MCLIVFCDNGFYGNVFTKANKHVGRQNVRKVNSLWWTSLGVPFALFLFCFLNPPRLFLGRRKESTPFFQKKNSRKFTVVLTTCNPDLSSVYFLVFVLFCSKPTSFLLSRKMTSELVKYEQAENVSSAFSLILFHQYTWSPGDCFRLTD